MLGNFLMCHKRVDKNVMIRVALLLCTRHAIMVSI